MRVSNRQLIWLAPALIGAAIGGRPSMDKVAICLWAVAALVTLVVVLNDRIAGSSISPVLLVSGLAVIYAIVVPLNLLRSQDTFLLGIDYRPWFWAASASAALSVASFSLGYAIAGASPVVAGGGPIQVAGVLPPVSRLARRLAIVAGLLFVYRIASYGLGGWAIKLSNDRSALEGATAYITYAPQYLAGLSLFLWHVSTTKHARSLYGGVLALLTFYFFATGVRYLVIVMIGSAGLLYYWGRRRRLLPRLRYLLLAVVVGLVVLGVGGNLRSQSSGGTSGIQASANRSFQIFTPMAGLIAHTEKHGYIMGTSYSYLAIQVIPRSLWPGKPFPPTYDALAAYTDIREGQSFPLWGELFLNFGWYGIGGGMLLFGYGMGRWLRYWLAHRADVLMLDVIAAVTIPLVVQWVSRGLFVQLVYNTMGLLIGPLILLAYERRLRRRRAPVLPPRAGGARSPTAPVAIAQR